MKKILLIVLATIILPHTAIAADGDVFTATVSGTPMSFKVISEAAKTCQVGEGSSTPCIGKSYSGAIDLPSEVNGYIVKSIADKAFSRCSLRSVTIPESVTTIGEYAFDNCSGLTCVNITDLAAWCKISFGSDSSNPLRYAHHLYMDGEEITNLVIPEGVTTIGDYAFRGCSGLTSVTIPESVTRIGDTAFYGCSGLTRVNITDLAAWCNIRFTSNYYYNIFFTSNYYGGGCSNPLQCAHHLYIDGEEIMNLVIPEGVTTIDSYAFIDCSGLTSVTIPSSVTTIGYMAFKDCSGLTSVTIPSSVWGIGGYAFDGCSGLTRVNITDLAAWCKIYFNESSANPLYHANHLFLDGEEEEIKELVIPDGVTGIGNYAFSRYSGLTSVTIPSSVTTIGGHAFEYCSRLTSVTIPEGVTSIGGYAFSGCSGLTSVTIPGSVMYIYDSVFRGCSGLTSVTIPNSVTSIGNNAFYNCTGLTSVTIPNSVTSIGNNAFEGCTGLTSVTIPESVTTIRNNAFSNCSNLNSVKILGKWVKNIGSTPFANAKVYVPKASGTLLQLWQAGYAANDIDGGVSLSKRTIIPQVTTAMLESKEDGLTYQYECDGKVTDILTTGLDPDKEYAAKVTASVVDDEGTTWSHTYDLSFKTKELTLTTQVPKVITEGNVIVAGVSNISDEETSVGFEWRRTDWTDDFISNTAQAYLYDGTMEGLIRNLNVNYLWKYRPYYKSDAGNYYYGEWVGIDPVNTNYFEPTVHTYASVTVGESTAEVKGYALRGTDKVTEQGFVYWKAESSVKGREKVASVPDDVMSVKASGQVMTATLKGLEPETQYCYAAYVKTEEYETFYGEVQTFTTNASEIPTAVEQVADKENTHTVQGVYDLQGRCVGTSLESLPRGIYIQNGRKFWVK